MPNQIIYVNSASNSPRSALVNAQNKSASMPDFIVGDDGTITICLLDADGNFAGWDAGGELATQYVFCVGLIGRPANLSYKLKVGADETAELTSASSPSELEIALNALEGVSASGGLDVVGYAGGTFKITWRTPAAKPVVEVASEGLPNSQVLSDVIVDGDAATRQIQAISLFVGAIAAGESAAYVSREATRIVETVNVDPETSEESIETSTETYNVNSDLKFNLSTKTIESLLALGAAENTRVRCELKHVSSAGAIRTIMTADATLYNRVCADAAQYQSLSDRINGALDEMHTYLSDVSDKRDYVEGAAYGTHYNAPVDEYSEFYQNNAKYFSARAGAAKTAAETAATHAALKADEAQTAANSAVQVAGVRALQLQLAARGELYMSGGYLSIPAATSVLATLPITMLITYYKPSDWDNSGNYIWCPHTTYNGTTGIALWMQSGTAKFLDLTVSNAGGVFRARLLSGSLLPTGRHTLAVVVGNAITNGRLPLTWYIDGIARPISTYLTSTLASTDLTAVSGAMRCGILNQNNTASTASAHAVALSRYMIFNAALAATSAADAGAIGYSIEQYNVGELPPPNLLTATTGARALLALDDYAITVGATTRVPDLTQGLLDAVVSGNVAGSRDRSIARLAAFINPST